MYTLSCFVFLLFKNCYLTSIIFWLFIFFLRKFCLTNFFLYLQVFSSQIFLPKYFFDKFFFTKVYWWTDKIAAIYLTSRGPMYTCLVLELLHTFIRGIYFVLWKLSLIFYNSCKIGIIKAFFSLAVMVPSKEIFSWSKMWLECKQGD